MPIIGKRICSLHCAKRDPKNPVPIQIQIGKQVLSSVSATDFDQVPYIVSENIRKVSEFFRLVFNGPLQSSLPDGLLRAKVHEGLEEVKIFWDSEKFELRVGNGDYLFQRLPYHLDLVCHAFTDGILDGVNCPEEVKESLSDVMALLVKFFNESNKNPSEKEWVIGNNLVGGRSPLRSFVNPGCAYDSHSDYKGFGPCKDPQVGLYNKRLKGKDCEGGIPNAGILSSAFYRFWRNTKRHSPYHLGAAPWETTGLVWFRTFEKLKNGARCNNMVDFANLTLGCAYQLHPQNLADPALNEIFTDLVNAWRYVGITEDEGLMIVFG